jgi:hypothetical protein
MTVRTDPEGNETDALFDLVEVEGREILERSPGAELVYVEPATISRLTPA